MSTPVNIKFLVQVSPRPSNQVAAVTALKEAFETTDVVNLDLTLSITKSDFERWMDDDNFYLGRTSADLETTAKPAPRKARQHSGR